MPLQLLQAPGQKAKGVLLIHHFNTKAPIFKSAHSMVLLHLPCMARFAAITVHG
jgi:hypothetical protein